VAKELLCEIGTEELPASFVEPALEELRQKLTELLSSARISHGEPRTFGTPRRLAIYFTAVAENSEDVSKEVIGPPVKVAFDAAGKASRAAQKFAEGLGLEVDKLERFQTAKGEYLGARVVERGRPAHQVLTSALGEAIHWLKFPKSMRWNEVEQPFARPVQWIAALLGSEVLPVVFGDVAAARFTYGHRFLSPQPIELKDPTEYEESLLRAQVIADPHRRKRLLQEKLHAAAVRAGGNLIEDSELLNEVTELVELPNPMVGSFDERHLDLPPEVLVQEMKRHQRYFAIADGSGKLMPKFIAVSNTPVRDEQVAIRGYERVLRARLADARFFFDEDRKQPLSDRVEKLSRVIWQQKLGTYAEKVARVGQIATWLAIELGRESLLPVIERAAVLSKADLLTGMVGEFPELQGIMGREYAKFSGEDPKVALAIFEQYLPRSATDGLPTEDSGAILGIADRLDTVCGIFGIGKAPTGAADPFGLRRAALSIIHVVLARRFRFSLSQAISTALAGLESKLGGLRKPSEARPQQLVLDFFRARLKALWIEEHRADVVEAILSSGFDDLVAAKQRLEALSRLVSDPTFDALATAFKRVGNIVEKQGKDVPAGQVDPRKLKETSEVRLRDSCRAVRARVKELSRADDYAAVLREITSLKAAVDEFFEEVMVMTDEREVRENRVRLLQEVRALFSEVADFSKIQAES